MPVSDRVYRIAQSVVAGKSDEIPAGIALTIVQEYEMQGGIKVKKGKEADGAASGGVGPPTGGRVLPRRPPGF